MMRAILVLWMLLVTLAMGQMQSGAQSGVQSGPPTGKCYRKEYCRAPNDKRLSSEKDPSNTQKCELYVATYDHEGKIISESCHTKYEGWGCDCSKCCSCSNTTKPDTGDKDPDKKKPDNGGNKDPDKKKPDNGGNKDPDEKKPDDGGNKDPDKKPDDKKPNKLQNSRCNCQANLNEPPD
ncbi:hypothetical protein HFD88_008109 [Aspergillus terreus]|nr:hypothetical protein HFD88_008109 [Aspergillus terreus]